MMDPIGRKETTGPDQEKKRRINARGYVRPVNYNRSLDNIRSRANVVKTYLKRKAYGDSIPQGSSSSQQLTEQPQSVSGLTSGENTELTKEDVEDIGYEGDISESADLEHGVTLENHGFESVLNDFITNHNVTVSSDDIELLDDKWNEILDDNLHDEEILLEEENVNHECLDGSQPIYDGHSMTIKTSMLLILQYAMTHNVSGSQLADLLTLISQHCLHSHACYTSVYQFKKYFANIKSPLQKHYFCSYCFSPVSAGIDVCGNKFCSKQLSSTTKRYFIEVPLKEQLQALFERKEFISLLKIRLHRETTATIQDIYDGDLYRSLAQPGGPLSKEFPYNISFTWNTDGVPVFKSSNFSLWPIYLAINELPYKERVKKENLILCGLWFGEGKPFMSTFTKPLFQSLKALEEGIVVKAENGDDTYCKGYLISGTADLPARSLIMNMNQYNGAFSCAKCLQSGKTFKTDKGGHVHTFPFSISDCEPVMRTKEQSLEDAKEAIQQSKVVNGIKGPSFLMGLKHYDYVKSTSIDYMHALLLGITKLMITLWFSTKHSSEEFSCIKFLDVIDESIAMIKPPNFITRIPRSLSKHLAYWKASELRSWLFFYSIPLLQEILDRRYFLHYASFVEAVYLLNTEKVSESDLEKSTLLFKYFVHMFPSLYGERYGTLNLHSLLHLPKTVNDIGPLWSSSCFPFEDANGQLMNLFHGTQHVELQIVSSVNIIHTMPAMLEEIQGTPAWEFCRRMKEKSHYRDHAVRGKPIQDDTAAVLLGKAVSMILPDDLYNELVTKVEFFPSKTFLFKRIMLRGQIFHSEKYTRVSVRNSYSIKYMDPDRNCALYGSIMYFCFVKSCTCEAKICACKCCIMAVLSMLDIVQPSVIHDDNYLPVRVTVPHIKVVRKTNRQIVISVQQILSMLVNVVGRQEDGHQYMYLCERPNNKETD